MRILFTTLPGTGHLQPLLPVAGGLRDAGHDVAFAASGAMAPQTSAAGYVHHAVGRPWHTSDLASAFPAITAIPPGPARYAAARRIFAGEAARSIVGDLLALGERWQPDLIVRDAAEYGGYLAAEVLGIPHVVVRTDSGSSSWADRGHVAAELDELRSQLGLPPDPTGDRPFHHLLLSFAPPGLDEEPGAPTGVRLRPLAADRCAPPDWIIDVAARGEPVVYATLGTVYNSPELLGMIVDALAWAPLQVVLTTGGRTLPTPLPPNVHVAAWLPQDAVLPYCTAVVTHGGYGTVSAALGHGLPMVCLPISADQPMNAERLTDIGVAVTLGPDERTAGTIRAATRTVLDEPTHRCVARRLARQAGTRPGLAHGLHLLELLAVGGAMPDAYGDTSCPSSSISPPSSSAA